MIRKADLSGEMGFFVDCDGCSHYKFFAIEDFKEMRIEAQRQGWLFKYDGELGEWKHLCQECKGKR